MHIRDVLDRKSVMLDAAPADKNEAISMLVGLMESSGCLKDPAAFKADVLEREEQSSTGLGEGIALPHAKSAAVEHPALACMIVPEGVDFDSFDGEPAYLLFMIASPLAASDAHLDVLAKLSTLLMDTSFRDGLLKARSVDECFAVIDAAESKTEKEDEDEADSAASQEEEVKKEEQKSRDNVEKVQETKPKTTERRKRTYDLVAVTACPAGLSHTYMAAEALELKAKELGYTIKVEADGAAGNRNQLMPEDIASAKAVIVAADRAVEIDRFMGKRMVRTGVVDGVHRAEELIKRALDPNCPVFKGGGNAEVSTLPMRMYRHLMSGLTYILPLAATTGILSAVARLNFVNPSGLGLFLDTIGYSLGVLLFPVLSAFIAFSMAGRMALVAGFTGGIMADMAAAGIFAAVLNGFVGGGVAIFLARSAQRFLKGHDAMFALLVYPIAGAVLTTLIAQFFTNIPAALITVSIRDFLTGAGDFTLIFVGAVLGGMMSADMGGPFNKIAYALGVLLLADSLPENGPGSMVMGSVMLGGMVPPVIAGCAVLCAPFRFNKEEKNKAFGTVLKGLLFITEGVLFYIKDAPRLRIACIIGSAVAGGCSMFFRCGVVAPHGGVFIMPLALNPVDYLLSLAIGTIVGTLFFVILKQSCTAAEAPSEKSC